MTTLSIFPDPPLKSDHFIFQNPKRGFLCRQPAQDHQPLLGEIFKQASKSSSDPIPHRCLLGGLLTNNDNRFIQLNLRMPAGSKVDSREAFTLFKDPLQPSASLGRTHAAVSLLRPLRRRRLKTLLPVLLLFLARKPSFLALFLRWG